MGADLLVCQECPVKEALGGASELIRLKKTEQRLEALVGQIEASGQDPAEAEVTTVLITADGPIEKRLTIAEMRESTAPLARLSHHCGDCSANVFDAQFGCWAYVGYPITESAQDWLAARLQPSAALGGWLFEQAVAELGCTGELMSSWRERGLIEGSPRRRCDQILEAVFCFAEPLDPIHCMQVLVWLGALHIDGAPPPSASDPEPLQRLATAESDARASVADFDVGAPSDDPSVAAMQAMLSALHIAWVLDVPLYVDA